MGILDYFLRDFSNIIYSFFQRWFFDFRHTIQEFFSLLFKVQGKLLHWINICIKNVINTKATGAWYMFCEFFNLDLAEPLSLKPSMGIRTSKKMFCSGYSTIIFMKWHAAFPNKKSKTYGRLRFHRASGKFFLCKCVAHRRGCSPKQT